MAPLRRLAAPFIAIGLLSLSCSLTSPPGGPSAASDAFDYSAFESSDAAHLAATLLGNLETGLLPEEISRVAVAIAAESSRAELPAELVLALIQVESSGFNFAVSPRGAMGLMQLMPATGESVARRIGMRWLGPQTLFDPVANVRLGVVYLHELIDRYGSWKAALAAYNWGPTRIGERLQRGESLPAVYAQKVLSIYATAKNAPRQI